MGSFRACCLALAVAACSSSAGFHDLAQRDSALSAFRSGHAALSCASGFDCTLKSGSTRSAAERFAQAEQWNNLAEAILAGGPDNDLSWFYLGLAAQGLGYPSAARTYYETSLQRTTAGGLASCNVEPFNMCGSVTLPADARKMLAEVRSARAPARTARSSPPGATPVKAEPQSAAASAATPWVEPPAAGAAAAPAPAAASNAWISPSPPAAAAAPAAAGSAWTSPPPAPVAPQ